MSNIRIEAHDLVKFEIVEIGKAPLSNKLRVKIAVYVQGTLQSERWYYGGDTNNITVKFE